MTSDAAASRESATRCGFLVLVGPPNVGKSTLLNAILGERLSISSPRAQTTWERVTGIRTSEDLQIVVVDTPGVVAGKSLLHRSMLLEVERGIALADALAVVLDGTERPRPDMGEALRILLSGSPVPRIVAANKSDLRRFSPAAALRFAEGLDAPFFALSARTGAGVGALVDHVGAQMPVGPFLYPAEDLAVAPVRFFAREFIRAALFRRCHQEIPYATGVRIEEFREGEDPVYIAASLHVERKSQKGMVIGQRGRQIRALGVDARRRIERFLGRRVYLELWVKVSPGWRRKRKGLAMFGYEAPP